MGKGVEGSPPRVGEGVVQRRSIDHGGPPVISSTSREELKCKGDRHQGRVGEREPNQDTCWTTRPKIEQGCVPG